VSEKIRWWKRSREKRKKNKPRDPSHSSRVEMTRKHLRQSRDHHGIHGTEYQADEGHGLWSGEKRRKKEQRFSTRGR